MFALSTYAQEEGEQPEITREEAVTELIRAIDEAQQAYENYPNTTPGIHTALQTTLLTANIMKSSLESGGFLADRISTATIVTTYTTLDNLAKEAAQTTLPYHAALLAIDQVSDMNITGSSAIALTARTAVSAALSKDAITTALLVMRTSLITLLNAGSVPEGTPVTALIGNNSFETGDDTNWFTLGAGTDTGVMENSDKFSTNGTDGDYLFNTSQLSFLGLKAPASTILQPLVLLPAGDYRLIADMTSSSKCYLTAMTVSLDDVEELKEKVYDENGEFSVQKALELIADLYSKVQGGDASALLEYLEYMKYAEVTYSTPLQASTTATFCNHELTFRVKDNKSLIIIMANAGAPISIDTLTSIDFTNLDLSNIAALASLLQKLKLDAFKADNFRLTFLNPLEESGIHTPSSQQPSSRIHTSYTISGVPAKECSHGVVITNGRKVLR